jgi:hypothetical protein
LDEILETHGDIGRTTTTTLHLMSDDKEEITSDSDDGTCTSLKSGYHREKGFKLLGKYSEYWIFASFLVIQDICIAIL